jgi:hypothetical protein
MYVVLSIVKKRVGMKYIMLFVSRKILEVEECSYRYIKQHIDCHGQWKNNLCWIILHSIFRLLTNRRSNKFFVSFSKNRVKEFFLQMFCLCENFNDTIEEDIMNIVNNRWNKIFKKPIEITFDFIIFCK